MNVRNAEYVYKTNPSGRPVPYVTKSCEWCGEASLIPVRNQYCSKSCSSQSMHAKGLARAASGPEHHRWTGENASYSASHRRIYAARGKADHCENRPSVGCWSVKYEWAHIHGTDIADPRNYRSLCKTCHQTYDGLYGENHVGAKLSDAQVAAIRELHATGNITQAATAQIFGVSSGLVSQIIRGVARVKAYQPASDLCSTDH
jgi:hypothetical protein